MAPKIDIYCHIFPERFFAEMTKVTPMAMNLGKRLRSITKLFDLDARFKEMDDYGDYRQIVSLPNPPIEEIAAPDAGIRLARIANDEMAELCRKHPQRFPTFAAALCLTDVEGSVAEARRAVTQLGARGVLLYTSIAGAPLDAKKFEPLFATIAELDAAIWLHPARTAAMSDYVAEPKSRYEMWWCLGWPYDTSVAMIRLVFCGLFDRHPKLKIITDPLLRRSHRAGAAGAGRAHLGRGLFAGAVLAEAAAHGLSARLLRRHRDVRRRRARAALRAGVFRRRARGVRLGRAARADRSDHQGDRAARAFAGRRAQGVLRQCRAAVGDEIHIVIPGRGRRPQARNP